MFASVTGVPEGATSRPSVRTVAFVSKQDPETLLYMAKAVRDGRLKIPISQQLPLRDARQGISPLNEVQGANSYCSLERRRSSIFFAKVSGPDDV